MAASVIHRILASGFCLLVGVFATDCSEKAVTRRRVKIYMNNCGFIPDQKKMVQAL